MVNFKNTIIIMTSNMGSQLIRERFEHLTDQNRAQVVEDTRNEVLDLMKKTIRPEFLNRIDDIIMFLPLTKPQIRDVVRLQVNTISKLLKDIEVGMTVSDSALDFIAEAGFDPEFGARPVKRVLQRELLNELSKKLIAQEVDKARPIVVDSDGEKLVFRN